MSDLIDTLQSEHRQLLQTFEQLSKEGLHSARGRELLFAAKDLLVSHLEKEDAELYPQLDSWAKQDEQLRRMLASFSNEMRDIAGSVNKYFTQYVSNSRGMQFAEDTGRLIGVLKARINKEELILYPEFSRRNG